MCDFDVVVVPVILALSAVVQKGVYPLTSHWHPTGTPTAPHLAMRCLLTNSAINAARSCLLLIVPNVICAFESVVDDESNL